VSFETRQASPLPVGTGLASSDPGRDQVEERLGLAGVDARHP
jgi:hypothetical protein